MREWEREDLTESDRNKDLRKAKKNAPKVETNSFTVEFEESEKDYEPLVVEIIALKNSVN